MTAGLSARVLMRVSGALLLLALGACGGGCAGRRPADDAAAAPAPPVTETPPPPTPTPRVVPPELACVTDADCTTSPYPHPVAAPADCYCPTCPQPLAAAAAARHEEGWHRRCGPEWEEATGCQAPMCRRPPPAVCRDGACVAGAPSSQ